MIIACPSRLATLVGGTPAVRRGLRSQSRAKPPTSARLPGTTASGPGADEGRERLTRPRARPRQASPSLCPATRRDHSVTCLLHRISTRKVNVLSPRNLLPGPGISLRDSGSLATLSLPQRIARHRAGATASGLLRAGRSDASPCQNPGANGRAQGHEVSDLMARWGQGRSGCGWVFGPAVATGIRKDLRDAGNPATGGTHQEGVRGVARPGKDRVRAPGAFSDSSKSPKTPGPKRNGTRLRWGPRSRQGYFSASVAPVPDP